MLITSHSTQIQYHIDPLCRCIFWQLTEKQQTVAVQFTNSALVSLSEQPFQKAIHKIRFQPSAVFDQCPHPLPEELLISLNVLLRHELGAIAGLEEGASFNYSGRDLSVLVLSSVSEAVESYCGVANVDAPFFNLSNEMERRIRDRRRELLVSAEIGAVAICNI